MTAPMTPAPMSPATAAQIMARAYTHQSPWSEKAIADTLAQSGCIFLHAPHGFLIARQILDEAEILAVAVDPDAQRSGIATRLITAFHDAHEKQGIATAFLEVASQNTAARDFYKAHGYTESGLRKRYYRRPDGNFDDAVLMARATIRSESVT